MNIIARPFALLAGFLMMLFIWAATFAIAWVALQIIGILVGLFWGILGLVVSGIFQTPDLMPVPDYVLTVMTISSFLIWLLAFGSALSATLPAFRAGHNFVMRRVTAS